MCPRRPFLLEPCVRLFCTRDFALFVSLDIWGDFFWLVGFIFRNKQAQTMDDGTLDFVAGGAGSTELTPVDSDLASWLVMSGDLLGSSSGGPGLFGLDEPIMHSGRGQMSNHDQHLNQHQYYPHHQNHGLAPENSMHQAPQNGSSSHTYQNAGIPMAPPTRGRGRKSKAPSDIAVGGAPGAAAAASPKKGRPSKRAKTSATSPTNKQAAGEAGQDGQAGTQKDSVVKTEVSDENAADTKDEADMEGLTPAEKRQRRLEKNREIARNCRKRKNEKYKRLEAEVIKLRQYNQQLEKQLNKGRDGLDREVARKAELDGMKSLLNKKCTEAEMRGPLTSYKEMYSDFGRERNAAIAFHMSQLKNLLIPNTVSKMTLWSLQQDDEFYDEKVNHKKFGGGIWNMLTSELKLTDEQKKMLLGMRHGIRSQRKNVAECLRILKELETRVGANFESMSKQMDMVMGTITPTQQSKFLLWIEKNKACTYMLNNMWNSKEEEEQSVITSTDDDDFDDSASTTMSTISSNSSSVKP